MVYTLKWLTGEFDKGKTLEYIFFWGHSKKDGAIGKFIFSQWYPSAFVVDGIEYKTAEHWMMAQKAALFKDDETFKKIIRTERPHEVKELGRQIMSFDEVKWNERKFEIVKLGNIHKFNQNKELGDFLMSTGDKIIVEASPNDFIWGIGLSADSPLVHNPHAWRGENLLGFALMEVRDFLRNFGSFKPLDNPMLPPWKKYPTIDPLDMFWRMGAGEEYIIAFHQYFTRLPERDKKVYVLSYPALVDWTRFVDLPDLYTF